MAQKSRHAKLVLTDEEKQFLEQTRRSRTAPARDVQRAQILWLYHSGQTVSEIAHALKTTRKSVLKWIDKGLQFGVKAGVLDTPHKPREAVITDDAKAWVIHLACSQPKNLGYAAELWSRSALARHIRQEASAAGFPALAKAGKATVQRILAGATLQPHKVKYYLQRRDPEFDSKMRDVLTIYKEVALQNEERANGAGPELPVITLSLDEKPGVQAIGNSAPDRPPVPGKHPTVARDPEYQRFGTLSILAALDLHTGHVLACVEPTHSSTEFIGLLKKLDAYYAPQVTIRVILDNHSAHISKQTRAYLASRPNRFKYVLTPKHGSWLNLIESLFGKMGRTFLRGIRVASLDELKQRILKGIEEINACPVVHRWKAFDGLEDDVTDIF